MGSVSVGVTCGSVAWCATEQGSASKSWWSSWFPTSSPKPSTDTSSSSPPTKEKLPFLRDLPEITTNVKAAAPQVPPATNRREPAHIIVEINTTVKDSSITRTGNKFPFWTFDDQVPGPIIRCRVGDHLEIRYTNEDENGMAHNIDFHGVTGPGGGAPTLLAEQGQTKAGVYKMMYPGLFVYHCAAAPLPMHVANGMYGVLLVEPEEGLPPVDREYYVLQSEFYTEPDPDRSTPNQIALLSSYTNGIREDAQYVVFNGREGALTDKPLTANVGERVRIFFGNGGPNLVSSFHVIGTIFDKVYRDGDLISAPGRGIQTVLVPPGGATVVEFECLVPGNYTLVDHALFRVDKGCVGFLKVAGAPHPEIYTSYEPPIQCGGCKLHD